MDRFNFNGIHLAHGLLIITFNWSINVPHLRRFWAGLFHSLFNSLYNDTTESILLISLPMTFQRFVVCWSWLWHITLMQTLLRMCVNEYVVYMCEYVITNEKNYPNATYGKPTTNAELCSRELNNTVWQVQSVQNMNASNMLDTPYSASAEIKINNIFVEN